MSKKSKKNKLSPMQDKFVHNLVKGMTQEKAYIKAGYSPKQARTNSSRLSAKEHVIKELAIRKSRAAKLADVSRANILKEYARIAFLDPRKFYDKTGKLKPILDLDGDAAAAFSGKVSDKLKALDSLSKIEGLFEKDNKQKGEGFAETFSNLLDEIDGGTCKINGMG